MGPVLPRRRSQSSTPASLSVSSGWHEAQKTQAIRAQTESTLDVAEALIALAESVSPENREESWPSFRPIGKPILISPGNTQDGCLDSAFRHRL